MLSEEIQFLSKGFAFLAMSKFFRVRFRLLVAWNVDTVIFLPIFCFLVIFVLLMLVWSVLFLVAVISLLLYFLLVVFESLYRCNHAFFNAGESSSSFFSWHMQSMYVISGCKALCMVISFLVLWSICLSSSVVLFNNGPEYFTGGK